MKLSWMLVVCSLIASYCISQTPSYQKKILAGENAFVAYARKHLLEISSSDSATNDLDLLPLLQMIGKSNVLALGEPSHGSHEPLAFRNRLFRFLVEKGGFTAIVIECGMAQSRDANIYVAGGPGSATDAARKLSIAGPSPETVALLEWMRSYNANPDHIVKIHFYGMDVSLVGFPGDTARSHAAIDEVLHYLGKADKSAAARLGKAMKPWLPRISVKNYSLLTPAEHTRLSGLIDEMWTVLKKKKQQYIQSTSPAEFEWALRCAMVARQTDLLVRTTPPDVTGQIPADAWKAVNVRDSSMMENVRWIMEQSSGGKVLVFAHNAHVKNESTVGSVWDAFGKPPTVMGQYLKQKLGDALFILGSSIDPLAATAQPNNLDDVLDKVGVSRYVLDLRNIDSQADLTDWLRQERPMQANKHHFFRLHTVPAFDALLFMKKDK